MATYQVLDNGRPADCFHINHIHASWNQSNYPTFLQAYNYAIRWLGIYRVKNLPINKAVDYSGYGDTIEIRKVY